MCLIMQEDESRPPREDSHAQVEGEAARDGMLGKDFRGVVFLFYLGDAHLQWIIFRSRDGLKDLKVSGT